MSWSVSSYLISLILGIIFLSVGLWGTIAVASAINYISECARSFWCSLGAWLSGIDLKASLHDLLIRLFVLILLLIIGIVLTSVSVIRLTKK
jgi:hypothetical protein